MEIAGSALPDSARTDFRQGSAMFRRGLPSPLTRTLLAAGMLLALLGGLCQEPALAWDDAYWWDGFVPPGVRGGGPMTGGDINVMLRSGSQLYVGGDFDTAGDVPASNIARWDGERWHALGEGVDGIVHALCFYYDGLYVGGEFATAGGESAPFVARWVNGAWARVGQAEQDFDDVVRCFAVYHDELYAGGDFEYVGDIDAWHVAKYDYLDWHEVTGCGLGMEDWMDPATVEVLAVYMDTLRAGGHFEACGDHEAPFFAKLEEDNERWVAHDTGEGLDWDVLCLCPWNIDLWIGGSFGSVNGADSEGLAWLGSGGFLHAPLGGGADHAVTALAVHNGLLHVATRYGIRPYGSLYVEDPHWMAPLGDLSDAAIKAYAMDSWGGDLYAAGSLADGIARWDGEGWRRLGAAIIREGSGHNVQALCAWEDGVAAGGFMGVETADPTVWCGFVGYFDGATWFPLGGGFDWEVRALAVYDGDLYAAGEFDSDNQHEVDLRGVARWDGEAWQPLGGGLTGVNGEGYCLALYDGGLAVGGSFDTADGVPAPARVALWNGAAFSALGDGMNGPVDALAVLDGVLIAGGSFSIGGEYHHVARLEGGVWQPMDEGLDGRVHALALRHGQLHAGGVFSEVGGEPCAGLARWSGAAWEPVGGGVGGVATPCVRALHEVPAGLLVGGAFATAGGEPAGAVALWTGTAWRHLGSGLSGGIYGEPEVMSFCAVGGELYLGGSFDYAGEQLSCGIARWQNDLTPVAMESFALNTVDGGVEICWRTAATDEDFEFQLEAERDGFTWRVDHSRIAPGRYWARDASPLLAAGGRVEYRLFAREGQEGWRMLRREDVLLPGPIAPAVDLTIHPNPGNPSFRLELTMPLAGRACVAVYDVQGHRLRELLDGKLAAGQHGLDWDGSDDRGRDLAAGVYFLRVETAGGGLTRKAVLLY